MIRAGLALVLASLSLHAGGQDVSADEWSRLKNRDILAKEVRNHEGIHGVKVAFLVKARPEAVWNLLVDHNHKRFREVFNNVRHVSEVGKGNENGARLRYRVGYLIWSYDYVLQRNYTQPGRRMTWHRVEGDFKSVSGEWAIHKGPDDEHQLVTCESFLDFGSFVPTALLSGWAMEGMQGTARRMREHLEADGK